jgi:hypothetical protein
MKPNAVEQEPVAWMYDWHADGEIVSDWVSWDYDEAHSPTMGCHNIRPLYIQPQPLAVERERNFCERCGKRLGVADHIHTCTPPQPDDEHDELFCWKVQGLSGEYTGYYAEEEAKAVAKRIGGNCFAFPLYVQPQPAQEWQEIECPCCGDLARASPPAPVREWVGLTDVEVGDALIDLPILGNGYFLRIAKAIEKALKEKNI